MIILYFRLYPVGLGSSRVLTEDTTIGGYHIPTGVRSLRFLLILIIHNFIYLLLNIDLMVNIQCFDSTLLEIYATFKD